MVFDEGTREKNILSDYGWYFKWKERVYFRQRDDRLQEVSGAHQQRGTTDPYLRMLAVVVGLLFSLWSEYQHLFKRFSLHTVVRLLPRPHMSQRKTNNKTTLTQHSGTVSRWSRRSPATGFRTSSAPGSSRATCKQQQRRGGSGPDGVRANQQNNTCLDKQTARKRKTTQPAAPAPPPPHFLPPTTPCLCTLSLRP